MLNHITIMGRLTKNPELRHTQSGTAVASFSIACERDFAAKDSGERAVDYIDCVAWRHTGEFISKYFGKGSPILVEGRLQMRDWTDREGGKRRAFEVICDQAYFCGGDKKKASEPEFEELGNDDGELPFDLDSDDDGLPL